MHYDDEFQFLVVMVLENSDIFGEDRMIVEKFSSSIGLSLCLFILTVEINHSYQKIPCLI